MKIESFNGGMQFLRGSPAAGSQAPAEPPVFPARKTDAGSGSQPTAPSSPPAPSPDGFPDQSPPSSPSSSSGQAGQSTGTKAEANSSAAKGTAAKSSGGAQGLDPRELAVVAELKQTDTKVRAHEQAHMAAGGSFVRGGASFTFQTGPDGRSYAVAGEVSIDTSPVSGNPRATAEKMQTVRAAALAPAEPSPQDRQVAAQAAQIEAQARSEAATMDAEEAKGASRKTGGEKGAEGPESAESAEGTEGAESAEGAENVVPASTSRAARAAYGGGSEMIQVVQNMINIVA